MWIITHKTIAREKIYFSGFVDPRKWSFGPETAVIFNTAEEATRAFQKIQDRGFCNPAIPLSIESATYLDNLKPPSIIITDPNELRLLANLLYKERNALTNCACAPCMAALQKNDELWNRIKHFYNPYPRTTLIHPHPTINGETIMNLTIEQEMKRLENMSKGGSGIPGAWYLHGEDLAPGLVGPFDYKEDALEHIEFQRVRGDAAVCYHNNTEILTEEEAMCYWAWDNNRHTPEEDKEPW